MPTIKRYTNRKLYDMDSRRYVTLEEIGQMVRDGEEVQVEDYATGAVITQATLLQVLFDDEKRTESRMPAALLTRLVNHGRQEVSQWMQTGTAADFFDEFDRRAEKLVEQKQLTRDEADRLRGLFTADMESESDASQTDVQGLMEEVARLEQRLKDLES